MGKSTTPRVQGANKGHSYPRLFTKAAFVGYTRNLANQKCNNHLLELDGVKDATASYVSPLCFLFPFLRDHCLVAHLCKR